MLRDILSGEDAQVDALVRVVQAADPDVLVLADMDFDLEGRAAMALAQMIGGYPFHIALRPNRGVQSGQDRNGDGRLGTAEDAQGYGEFAGQSGMVVLSRLPFVPDRIKDHSQFLWRDLPATLGADAVADQRLATTGFYVIPVRRANGDTVSLLTWHATAPVFDGPDDFNGRRNHDETAFWLDYLTGMPAASHFVLLGTANLDPVDGDGRPEALLQLLSHPHLQDPMPESEGGVLAAGMDAGANTAQSGNPALDTADWPDDPGWPGNLRVDYVLPSRMFDVLDAGVVWPAEEGSLRQDVLSASRHRLIWADLLQSSESGD